MGAGLICAPTVQGLASCSDGRHLTSKPALLEDHCECSMPRRWGPTLPRGLGWFVVPLFRAWRASVRDSTAESRRHLALMMPVGLMRWKGPSVKGLLLCTGPAKQTLRLIESEA